MSGFKCLGCGASEDKNEEVWHEPTCDRGAKATALLRIDLLAARNECETLRKTLLGLVGAWPGIRPEQIEYARSVLRSSPSGGPADGR